MNPSEGRPLDFDYYNARYYYESTTGAIRNKITRGKGKRQQAGAIATTNDGHGYLKVSDWINGKQVGVRAHRLAWLLHTGEDPGDQTINHKNHCRSDNSAGNLMLATVKDQNEDKAMNSRNKSGYAGVCWDKDNQKWRAYAGGKYLGLFEDVELAGFVAELTRDKLGYSPNHGRPLQEIQNEAQSQ